MTSDQLKIAWGDTSRQLKSILNEDTYDRWIAGINPVRMDNRTLVLGVSNDVFSEWLNTNYRDVIREAFEKHTGLGVRVVFEGGHEPLVVDDFEEFRFQDGDDGDGDVVSEPSSMDALRSVSITDASAVAVGLPSHKRLNRGFNGHFSFDTFVVGENNKFAYAAATAVATAPGQSYNPLFIHGSTGLGKTHLQQAVAQNVLKRDSNVHVEYLTSEEFANHFINALRDRKLPTFRKRFRNVDLLLIDDVQFFSAKEQLQEEFFHTFNALYNNHRQIILTSDRPPHEINGLEKRLVSRFEWGLTTEVMVPDIETRVAILRKKQQEHAIQLGDEIIFFIADRIRSNVRRLEGALIRLVSFASMTGNEVTREKAIDLLRPILDEESSNSLTVQDIQRKVAEHYDIRLADMTSKRRPKNIAFPRQVAMYLSRTMTPNSLPQIADNFNRNHATVLHAVESISKKMNADEGLRNTVMRLERAIKNR